MDLVNNYGSSDEEDNAPVTISKESRINTAPDVGFDVIITLKKKKKNASFCPNVGLFCLGS